MKLDILDRFHFSIEAKIIYVLLKKVKLLFSDLNLDYRRVIYIDYKHTGIINYNELAEKLRNKTKLMPGADCFILLWVVYYYLCTYSKEGDY